MLLDDLLGSLDVRAMVHPRPGIAVADVVHDSRRVGPGALFVCVPGRSVDGHDLAEEAVGRGAVALVVEREVPAGVPQAVVADARAAMAPLADAFHGRPTERLKVAGVTGTNGKTTTAFLTHAVLSTAGVPTGLLGTIEQRVGGVRERVERTTPEALDLQATFRRMVDAGDQACAMEVSSHALALHRVDHVRFAAVAFTNLSQDHLDFHGTMEAYFEAKARLFDGRAPRAVNADDPWGARLPAELRFGAAPDADVRADEVVLAPDATSFRLTAPGGQVPVTTPLRGAFNVSNALAAAPGVPGRMEPVECGQPFTVLVDYAHTPDALQTVLATARGLTHGTLHVVFGCGGDRDREKRPQMGAVAAALADRVVLTSDNPRGEDPEAIVAEILAGIEGRRPLVELDRRAAIALALEGAAAGDVVVIAGKGHEQGQEARGTIRPFDDRDVACEVLA